jgi:glycosyltransferase involved in cell wall biosynthesis
MKVGLVVPGFSSDVDDWCIPVLVDVVRELSRQADVHVFALRYPHRRDRYRAHGATVHSLGGAEAHGLRRLQPLASAWYHILAEHRRGPFVVLHGLWADEPGFTAVAIARVLHIPSVVSIMGGELVAIPDIQYGGSLSRANRLLLSRSLTGADRVTAGSGQGLALARHFLSAARSTRGGRLDAERLVWGVDSHLFQGDGPARDLAGARRVLHVGSLVPVKDQVMLLQAIARVRTALPCVHLHVVGDGPLRPRLIELAESLGLAANVTFHGSVERRELGAYYRAADLVVVSSRHEAQSAVVLEATLCGTPVVGTAVGLVADLAPERAVAVPIGDEAALAAAICAGLQSHTGELPSVSSLRLLEAESVAAHTADSLLEMYATLLSMRKAR